MTDKPYIRPPWPARVIGGRAARLFQPAIVHSLTVPGRVTGRERTVPVAVLDHGGQRYLISAYGDTEWSRNLRAAGHARLRGRRRSERIETIEVPTEDRRPLIAEYLRQYGRLPTVQRTFDALPDPANHPTFRITDPRSTGDELRTKP
ncbi:nitroreductase family deazaflavin-dependent oxidoreductase [Frankia sp. Cas3]|uniref:nitroreductase family deazaflavin-dependent oxidoreductase n=1 Tax=Frankia sp. Cas3 TaxID=3073926 RepID=UPI002AD54CBD|nr:nitroreductase family deazaflavin-dependent oxidoreductase [Frankia sp. Cas3]